MKAVISLDQALKNFYYEEKKILLENYPGLTLHRLRSDLKLFAEIKGVDSDELFESPYFPSSTHPLTTFFNEVKTGKPLEYITGYSYFYRSLFNVNPNVLIPRSETEILVEMVSSEIQKSFKGKPCRLLDVGVGSGAIALSLLLEDHAKIDMVATDISSKALDVAKKNAFLFKNAIPLNNKIHFIETDRLNNIEGEFDFIISNPPYIKSIKDQETVHSQVKKFEPDLALFLEDSEYDQWFSIFFHSILKHLKKNGLSFIEGHEDHLEDLKKLALEIGFTKVDIIQDYTQRNRFLRLRK